MHLKERKNYRSASAAVTQGVPQGSILGPVLFLLYVNGLGGGLLGGLVCQYADDTSVVLCGPDLPGLSGACSRAVEAMRDWCSAYALQLNSTKTGLLTFRKSPIGSESLYVRFNNQSVPVIESIKFLGVTLDSSLTWNSQTHSLVTKLHSFCALARRLREVVSLNTLRWFYFASVQSLLTYSIMFWGSSRGAASVFKAQKRIIRCMLKLHPRTSCKQHFKELSFLSLPSLYFLSLVLFVKKHPHLFNNNAFYHAEDMTVVTRGGADLSVPAHSSAFFKRAPLYRAIKAFNMLPYDIRSLQNVATFRGRTTKYLLQKCFYSFKFEF